MPSKDDHSSHVAILVFPFGSHPTTVYNLARQLASAAPYAFFSFLCTAKGNAPLEKVPAPNNLRLCAVPDGIPEGFVPSSMNPEEMIDVFLKATPGNYKEGMEVAVRGAGGARVSCVLSEGFLWFSGKMAEEMEVPWVVFWGGGTCSLSAHLYTDAIRDFIGVSDKAVHEKADHSLEFLPGMSSHRVRDLPEGVVWGNVDSLFSRLVHRMGQEIPRATAVLLNTFEGLQPAVIEDLKTKFNKCLQVAPLGLLATPKPSKAPDHFGCLPWLGTQAPASVAYIGFGTVASPPPPELSALAEGLEASGIPFLWSLKEEMQAHLPKGFLERTSGRGLVVPWTPQVEVFGHGAIGVFVTHCGWNSVIESIAAGIPMLCRPVFGDHGMTAREVSHVWKIGLVVENGVLTKEWVVSALNTVLRTEEGKKMRERASTLKELAIRAVGPGGSSTENFGALVKIIQGV